MPSQTSAARAKQNGDTYSSRVVPSLDPFAREARACFEQQAAAIAALSKRVDRRFGMAVKLLLATEGHVVVSGIGKSGLIGQKMAATFASTGTPSFFVHAAEAFHGDLGMITERDTVVLISYSGETDEVVRLLPHLKARGIPTIALCGETESNLGNGVDVALDVSVKREACPNNLAPTNSTLATLAMGDALAVSLIRMRAFRAEDFARCHPGGSLGRRLLGRVSDVMDARSDMPQVASTASVMETVMAAASSRCRIVLVVSGESVVGAMTPSQLRRLAEMGAAEEPVGDHVREPALTLACDTTLEVAEASLRARGASWALVVDEAGEVVGALERRE